jgi:3-dehydroquinate synthase
MKKIPLTLKPSHKPSEIIIADHFLFSDGAAKELRKLAPHFALCCDEAVAKLYGNRWMEHLKKLGLNLSLFTFPPGEQEKCRERKAELEDRLQSQKFGRDTGLIAMGGGVATDLIGFLASTYCRGAPLVFVPTTLLGMVDAAIGGKTGVNTRFGKNLIGTFYPAEKIFIDPSVLSSLPESEWTNGAAEVIKYALIRSYELFETLKKWKPEDPLYLGKIIHESVMIKAQIVEGDYEEKLGLRRIVNFGHTIAHALELLEDYRLSHGQAVAMGMLVEGYISMKMGNLAEPSWAKMEKLIRTFPFILKLSANVTKANMNTAFALDKKATGGAARFVILEKIGACHPFSGEYCCEIPKAVLDGALDWMIENFGGKA